MIRRAGDPRSVGVGVVGAALVVLSVVASGCVPEVPAEPPTSTTIPPTSLPGGNQTPVAAISAAPNPQLVAQPVAFDATGSSDDGTVVSYDWYFGDFATIQTAAPTVNHLYMASGSFVATVTVTDDDGATDTASVTVTVDPLPELCEPGSFSESGSPPCVLAPSGSYVDGFGATAATPAAPGYVAVGPGATSQSPCPAGTHAPGESVACIPAPVGYYVPDAASGGPTPAPPGSYVDSSSATSATPCPMGSFQASSASVSCVPAPSGSYVDGFGATAATPAAPGYVAVGPGATSQTPCPAGTYAPGESVACIPAPVGSYVPVPASPLPTPCPTGTTTLFAAATSESDCVVVGGMGPGHVQFRRR